MTPDWHILDPCSIQDLRRIVTVWAERVSAKEETPETLARRHCVAVESVVYAIASFYFDMGESKKALALVNGILDVRPDLRLHMLRIRIRMTSPGENNEKLFRDMALLGKQHFPALQGAEPQGAFSGWDLHPEKRLSLGFVCTFSNTWAMATTLAPLLKRLDRGKFRVTLFSIGRSVAPGWLAATADECVYVMSDDADSITRAVADRKIDLLFDLCGWLRQDLPLEVFLRRPSPVQVSWWNAPPAFGIKTMQYFLSEEGVLPRKYHANFLEKIHLLKTGTTQSFEFPEYPLTPPPFTRQPFFTFGAFTALYKVNDDVLAAWGEILQKAPNSRLFIKALHANLPYFLSRVEQALKPYKIDKSRLLFQGATAFDDTMSNYNQADLCLDTYSYGAVSTSSNALWQGIPTLTLDGKLLQAATTADVMRKAGLPQFVAKDRAEYIRKAVYFANNPQELLPIRRDIRAKLKQMPRFNPDLFTPGFEEACRSMWQDWLKDYDAGRPAAAVA
jgi:protein O-GlcNAc transferase